MQEVSEIRTVLGLVAAGLGVSLVPESVAGGERAGVVFRPLAGRARTVDLALAWREDDTSPAVAAFLAVAHDGWARPGRRTPLTRERLRDMWGGAVSWMREGPADYADRERCPRHHLPPVIRLDVLRKVLYAALRRRRASEDAACVA